MEEDTEGYTPFSFRHGALSYSIPARRHGPCLGKEHQEEADKAVALEEFPVQWPFIFLSHISMVGLASPRWGQHYRIAV